MLSKRPSNLAFPALNRFLFSTQATQQTEKPVLKHVTKISDLSRGEISDIMSAGVEIKSSPSSYFNCLKNKTLLMLFEKPSLRTRVSFEVGMTQLGGHAIFYSISDSPLGKKESIEDTGAVLSRYCDAIMARVNKKEDINGLAKYSTIPVINGLDNWAHPCQMLTDFMTIYEKKVLKKENNNNFDNLTMCYIGDCENNVTYDLMRIATILGVDFRVCGPVTELGFEVNNDVIVECAQIASDYGTKVPKITNNWEEAVIGCDVVYTDSWMSYGIPESEQERRLKCLMPYQVDSNKMKAAKEDAIFMNCLPALRGMEQTAQVIDGPQSVVFDQAENRLHSQKALLLYLINGHFKPL